MKYLHFRHETGVSMVRFLRMWGQDLPLSLGSHYNHYAIMSVINFCVFI